MGHLDDLRWRLRRARRRVQAVRERRSRQVRQRVDRVRERADGARRRVVTVGRRARSRLPGGGTGGQGSDGGGSVTHDRGASTGGSGTRIHGSNGGGTDGGGTDDDGGSRLSGPGRGARRRWRGVRRKAGASLPAGTGDLLAPAALARLEGAAVAVAAALGYFVGGYAPLLFLVLVLAPDLSFAGYLVDERWGVRSYNAAHAAVGPALLAAVGWLGNVDLAVAAALAWAAHVGADRALGLGLKYEGADFGDTHVQRLGGAESGNGRSGRGRDR